MSQIDQKELNSLSVFQNKILIIEDDIALANQLKWFLKRRYKVFLAFDPESAISILKKEKISTIILDLGLPPNPESPEIGLKLLKDIINFDSLAKIIVITAHKDLDTARKALNLGAYDFLSKPISENTLLTLIERAIYRRNLEEKFLEEREDILPIKIIAISEEMKKIIEEVKKISKLDVTCLILGESGTGKELIARLIHKLSLRKSAPFIVLDCASIPPTLSELELFGAEKGSYTGAYRRIEGKISLADKGTLFLDEIGELSLELQAKLLRFLETKEFTPIGGKLKTADVRIIAATNRDLKKEVERGKFRLDLFYRLNQITIKIPPLRERREDIIPLANYFIKEFSKEFKKNFIPSLSKKAEEVLIKYDFPGNVRELRNIILKAMIFNQDIIEYLPDIEEKLYNEAEFSLKLTAKVGYSLPKVRQYIEKLWVSEALKKNKGQISKAAKDLEIPRSTLYDLIKKYKVTL